MDSVGEGEGGKIWENGGLWVQVAAGQEARLGAQGGAPVSRAIGTSHPLSSWEIRENVLVSPKPYATLKGDAEYH